MPALPRPSHFASRFVVLVLASLTIAPSLLGQSVEGTRMLTAPEMSTDHLAFAYDADLWIANRDGSEPRRLTTHQGVEGQPHFSPNGQWIAFTGEYDGNVDVFVVSIAGGAPKRLTYHPAPDVGLGWSGDGARVLFRSQRNTYFGGFQHAMTVSVDTGELDRLEVPTLFYGDLSADNQRLAYTPIAPAMQQWKNYRGGRVSRVWLLDMDDLGVVEVPQPEGRSNDLDPVWVGDQVYFLSDRNGEFNLYSFDEESGEVEQQTHHDDFPIMDVSAAAGGVLVYEQAGYLHEFDTQSGQSRPVPVSVTSDLVETRARWADGADFIQTYHLSPTGARAVFEARGDIVTVPADKGDARALTATPGVHERSPAWSPDGAQIAYFTDVSGEYELHIRSQDGTDEPRAYPIDGAGFYDDPVWSPDGTKISFTDNSWTLFVLDVATGDLSRVAAEERYGPFKNLTHAWSPDSQWLAYTLTEPTYFSRVWLYSLASGESHAVTTGLGHVTEPVFDRSGKYLYFFGSTDAGPVQQWFAMSNNDNLSTGTLYLAVLDATEPSPLAPESDEETLADDADATTPAEGESGPAATTVDLDGLEHRIIPLGVDDGWYGDLQPGAAGHLYYAKRTGTGPAANGPASLTRFSLESREEETLLDRIRGFLVSADGNTLLARVGPNWHIAPAGKVDPSSTRIDVSGIQVRVEPRAEWAQMFREAWRINRDWFYDPDMHGADWDAMYEKYAAFLPDLATRQDLNRITSWMMSELAVGHSRGGGGEFIRESEPIQTGLLGADLEIANGRYRFARVFGGLNWNPEQRAPLSAPGVNVQPGEYLLAVNGRDLTVPQNPYAPFENTAEKQVSITVGPNADGSGARIVTVRPIASETTLRRRAWIEDNVQRVHEATNGRVAYVWVPNTTTAGWEEFKRYFFPQAHLDAIIVDERQNGGGQLADYVIDLLRRENNSMWSFRYGAQVPTPIAAIDGPKVMLVDEYAGSGGDFMPWLFRKYELGPLIGRRTWGGLVGVLGTPPLMDGAAWTAPNLGFWTPEEGYGIENVGIPPDIEVEQFPADVAGGADPQLERAIAEVLRMLEADPQTLPAKPPFPVRVRRPGGN